MPALPPLSGAYIYADLGVLKKHNDVRVLIQLTNDSDTVDPNNPAAIDESILQAAEAEAATTIDNNLRNVYDPLPLTTLAGTLTPEIQLIAAKLTWCNLWERRGDEPEQVTLLRQRLLKRLKEMGSPRPDENRNQPKSEKMMPIRATAGKARTLFDDSGYFDGLRSQGRRQLQGDIDNDNAGD